MHKGIAAIIILVVLLGACARGKDTAQSAAQRQAQETVKNGSTGQNDETAVKAREVQDGQIMDLSTVDASEETNWMNPKNLPDLKRKYQPPGMKVSVLLVKDTSVYSNLQRACQGVLGTLKPENN